jgi:hypothetical protein
MSNHSTRVQSGGAGNTATMPERRRHPRQDVCASVIVRCADTVIEGFTENLSYSGVLIQSLTGMPAAGEACRLEIDLPLGTVLGRGRVARLDQDERKFAVDIEHVDQNGHLLLAALVTADDV